MQVRELMTANPDIAAPEISVEQAARQMKDLNVGALPVCQNDRLVGMITDRDIAVRTVASGADPKNTPVRDSMTPDLAYCYEEQSVEEAAELMKQQQVRRLPVLSQDKRLVGMLSLGDVAVEADSVIAGETLESVSSPAEPAR